MSVNVPVAWGELFDKITILEIKKTEIVEPENLRDVERQLSLLIDVRDRNLPPAVEISELVEALADSNRRLWNIENAIRKHESTGDFGAEFVSLARSVYRENDRRATIKQQIDQRLGSDLTDVKQYSPY
jgi:hypothetical protein